MLRERTQKQIAWKSLTSLVFRSSSAKGWLINYWPRAGTPMAPHRSRPQIDQSEGCPVKPDQCQAAGEKNMVHLWSTGRSICVRRWILGVWCIGQKLESRKSEKPWAAIIDL